VHRCLTPLRILNQSEKSPSTPIQQVVSVYNVVMGSTMVGGSTRLRRMSYKALRSTLRMQISGQRSQSRVDDLTHVWFAAGGSMLRSDQLLSYQVQSRVVPRAVSPEADHSLWRAEYVQTAHQELRGG